MNKLLLNLSDHFEEVLRFNTVAGNLDKDKSEMITLYTSLCQEELLGTNELLESYRESDIEGIVDGLVDTFYVSTFRSYLLNPDLLSHQLYHTYTIEDFDKCLDNLQGYVERHPVEYTHEALSLVNSISLDMNSCLNTVHDSNMSKFIKVTGLSPEEVVTLGDTESKWIMDDYISKDKPIKCVSYQETTYGDDCYLVFRNENGKVVKPNSFVEPDFTEALYSYT